MKKILIFCALVFVSLSVSAQRINTASVNVRYENEGDAVKGNAWSARYPVLCEMISYHDFDIFGAQEVLHGQLKDMRRELSDYDYIGVGRDDGKKEGEFAPIFYKKQMFSLIDEGVFWLSETPDRPSIGWDAKFPRICTWGHFRHRDSGKEVWFFNTHFDHVGVTARCQSVQMILEHIESMTQSGDTVILTGDFNVDQNSEEYALLTDSEVLKDCYLTARVRHARNGTTNGFHINSVTESRIDHIYVSRNCEVARYGVLTDIYWPQVNDKGEERRTDGEFPKELVNTRREARTPSDHFPIAAQIELP
jgi:endonuclease/exonuclease/phosphatase family metal-dependent hydrolase